MNDQLNDMNSLFQTAIDIVNTVEQDIFTYYKKYRIVNNKNTELKIPLHNKSLKLKRQNTQQYAGVYRKYLDLYNEAMEVFANISLSLVGKAANVLSDGKRCRTSIGGYYN